MRISVTLLELSVLLLEFPLLTQLLVQIWITEVFIPLLYGKQDFTAFVS